MTIDCNGCDGLLELTVLEQDDRCNVCDCLLEVTVSGKEGGCHGW
jgi:hypothetical protein